MNLTLLLFYLIIQSILAFDCYSVTNQEYCAQLEGCSWDPNLQCQGNFSPSCSVSNCYYIDSSSVEITSDGTALYPFQTLSDGLKKLSSSDGNLIIINLQDNTTVDITQALSLSTNITILPLFQQNRYNIDFNKIPSSNTSSYTSVITVSKQLHIIGATFKSIFPAMSNKLRIFVLKAGTLIFQNVHIRDMNGPAGAAETWLFVYDSTFSTTKYSQFYYIEGSVTNTSTRFAINGPSLWKKVGFFDFHGVVLLSTVSFPIKFKNCTFTGGSFLLLQASNANITIENSTFFNSALNLFKLQQAKQVLITNTTFENIQLYRPLFSFIEINMKPQNGGYLYSIQDTVLKNFTTPLPLIFLNLGHFEFSLIRVRMEDIYSSTAFYSKTYQQQFGKRPFGICCTSYGTSLTIQASRFVNIHSSCLGLTSSKLSISSSKFDNSALNPDLTLSENSANDLDDETSGVTWIKVEGISTSLINGDKMILQGNTFSANNLLPLYGGVLSFKGPERAQIIAESNQFIGNSAVYGGAFYLKGIALSLSLKNNSFFNNSAFNGGAIYKTSPVTNFKLRMSSSSISTENDIFLGNTALGNGGCFFLDQESLTAKSSRFIANKALNGGAMYFINLDGSSQDQYGFLSNVMFKENVASNVGGALKLFFDYSQLRDDLPNPSIFENNQDIEKSSIHTSRPSYYQFLFYDILRVKDVSIPKGTENILEWLSDPQNAKLAYTLNYTKKISDGSSLKINQKSGQAMSQVMLIQVIDNKNKLANDIDGEKISIEITDFENNISDKTPEFYYHANYFIFDKGQIFVSSEFKLEGEPTTKAFLSIKSESIPNSFLKDADLLMDKNVEIDFVNCSVGEIFNKRTRTCELCQENSYSLGDPYTMKQCFVCVPNAQCLGRAMIAPDPGYWRFNNQTTRIFQSQISLASKGGFDSETGKYDPQGVCMSPYRGMKCDECIQGYASLGSRKGCFNCSNPFYYVASAAFLLIQLAAIFYLFRIYLMKSSLIEKIQPSRHGRENLTFPLIKIVITFLQVISTLFELRIGFPDLVRIFLSLTCSSLTEKAYDMIWGLIKIIPLGKDGFVIHCLLKFGLQNEKHLSFAKIIITSLIQPLFFWILLICISQTYLFLKKKSLRSKLDMKTMNLLLFMVIGYVLQPFILQTFFEIFKCQNYTPDLEESNSFMQESPSIRCYSYDHWMWSILPSSVSILIWMVVLPYFFFARPKNFAFRNFICGDFRQKEFHWEFFIFLRKAILMLIANIFDSYSTGLQIFLMILFLYLFFILQWKTSPFEDSRLNFAEAFSLLSSLSIMVLLFISSFSQQNNEYPKISYFISVLIFIIILSFYLQILSILKLSWNLNFKKKEQQNSTPLNEDLKPIGSQNFNSLKDSTTEEKIITPFENTQNKFDNQKAVFVRNPKQELPDSPLFKLITSLDTQRSEESHLLSSPRTSGNSNSALLRSSQKTKDHHS